MSLDHRRGAVTVGEARERILCGWLDCERYGVMLNQVRIDYSTDPEQPYRVIHLFCSERHKQYFINSHRDHMNLPTGERGRLI